MAYGSSQGSRDLLLESFRRLTTNLSGPMKQSCSTVQQAQDVKLSHLAPLAKIWGFQPGCPDFLEAHNLLNSLTALMTNGTPTGPSNGR